MTARTPPTPDEEAHVQRQAQRCREILAAGLAALRPPKADPCAPLQPRRPGEEPRWCEKFFGWRDPHALSAAPGGTGLPVMPLDNWPPQRNRVEQIDLDPGEWHRLEQIDLDPGEWLEAAE
jgi:hypothetical protein